MNAKAQPRISILDSKKKRRIQTQRRIPADGKLTTRPLAQRDSDASACVLQAARPMELSPTNHRGWGWRGPLVAPMPAWLAQHGGCGVRDWHRLPSRWRGARPGPAASACAATHSLLRAAAATWLMR